MNDGTGDGSDIKFLDSPLGAAVKVIGFGLLIPLAGYIALQTVAKPFYQLGQKVPVDGTNFLQSVFVSNPGPWSTRHPQVEFSLQSDIQIVDSSGGISVDKKNNKMFACMDNGLPAGCSYFITYKFSAAPSVNSSVRVICDGKGCKESPTVDLDIMMMALIGVGAVSWVIALFFTYQYTYTRRSLQKERNSTINKALSALLDTVNAQSDFAQAAQALAQFVAQQGKIHPAPKTVGDGGKPPAG